MTQFLDLDDLMTATRRIVGNVAVADYGLLSSAQARPQASVFGEDAYPSMFQKAAALLESLARNHALVDGNKRCAWMATVLFLGINGVTIPSSPDNDEALVLAVATGTLSVAEIAVELAKAAASASPFHTP